MVWTLIRPCLRKRPPRAVFHTCRRPRRWWWRWVHVHSEDGCFEGFKHARPSCTWPWIPSRFCLIRGVERSRAFCRTTLVEVISRPFDEKTRMRITRRPFYDSNKPAPATTKVDPRQLHVYNYVLTFNCEGNSARTSSASSRRSGSNSRPFCLLSFCDASLEFSDAFHLDTSADGSSVCLQLPSVLILSGFHVLVPSLLFKMPSPGRLTAVAVFYFIFCYILK